MNEIKHLLVTRVLRFQDTVEPERFWCAATALVEGRNKTLATLHFGHHVVIHIFAPFRLPNRVIALRNTAEITVCQNTCNM